MGSSAKPRRRRAAAPALQYDRQRGRPGLAEVKGKKRESVFGCLVFLLLAGLMVLMATLDMLYGDDVWQWAAESWPGGAYGFAVLVGILGPCLAVLAVYSLSRMHWKTWKQHRARTLTHTALGTASTAALLPYVILVFNAQDSGKWGKGEPTPPSWVFSRYPWLWAVGLLSSLATLALLIRYFLRRPHHARDMSPT
ncbi:hypothetical protein GCM10009601_56440 [Streptomyces thermospinosisporus]|uniref:DUF2269 domain-containing protein n=1 Tax=Streptomyces thermospinosisporus TaxID=161482 RepID=A0ABN1Z798_9ACTN